MQELSYLVLLVCDYWSKSCFILEGNYPAGSSIPQVWACYEWLCLLEGTVTAFIWLALESLPLRVAVRACFCGLLWSFSFLTQKNCPVSQCQYLLMMTLLLELSVVWIQVFGMMGSKDYLRLENSSKWRWYASCRTACSGHKRDVYLARWIHLW